MEPRVPLLVEDFEVGDRIYNSDTFHMEFGTVIDIADGTLDIRFDTGRTMTASAPLSDHWGRPLQMKALKPGVVISRVGFSGKRVHAVVVSYQQDVLLLRYLDAGREVTYTRAYFDLETQFKNWEMEG